MPSDCDVTKSCHRELLFPHSSGYWQALILLGLWVSKCWVWCIQPVMWLPVASWRCFLIQLAVSNPVAETSKEYDTLLYSVLLYSDLLFYISLLCFTILYCFNVIFITLLGITVLYCSFLYSVQLYTSVLLYFPKRCICSEYYYVKWLL